VNLMDAVAGFLVTGTSDSFSPNTKLKWTSSKPAVASVDQNGFVTALKTGKTVVKVAATDGSGKSTSATITVKIPVTSIAATLPLSGNQAGSLAAGAKLTPKLVVSPSNAASKKVQWVFDGDVAAAKALATLDSKTGKLTAKSTATAGSVSIKAVSAQNPSISSSVLVLTLVPVTKSVDFAEGVAGSTQTFFTVQSGTENYPVANYTYGATRQIKNGEGSVTTGIVYTSSNTDIATVNASTGQVSLSSPKKTGTATITATALDYSGKKAVYKVVAAIPASSITVLPKVATAMWDEDNEELVKYKPISIGKTGAFGAKLGTVFGTPTVTKLKWTVEKNDSMEDSEWTKYKKYVSVNSSGVVSVKNGFPLHKTFTVRATTTDGSQNISGEYEVYSELANTGIKFDKSYDPWTGKYNGIGYDSGDVTGVKGFYIDFSSQFTSASNAKKAHGDFTVTTAGGKSSVIPVGVGRYNYYSSDGSNRWYRAYFNVADTPGTMSSPQTFTVTVTSNPSGAKGSVTFKTYKSGGYIYIAV
jgi:hypothetical protein